MTCLGGWEREREGEMGDKGRGERERKGEIRGRRGGERMTERREGRG